MGPSPARLVRGCLAPATAAPVPGGLTTLRPARPVPDRPQEALTAAWARFQAEVNQWEAEAVEHLAAQREELLGASAELNQLEEQLESATALARSD